MPERFRLLYDRELPNRVGDLGEADLLEVYRHPTGPSGGRWLRTNFVSTLDGSIAGPDGRSDSINTPSDQHLFALHRALADVILVGAETVRTEGYRAVDLADWQRAIRSELGLAPFPTLAVITGSLLLEPAIAEPDGRHGPVMIMTTPHPEDRLAPFREVGIAIVSLPGEHDRVPLSDAVEALVRAGMPRILCEGGPRLHHGLLAADLVDELSLTLAPTVVGGEGRRSTDGPALPADRAFRPQHLLVAPDDTVFAGYRRAQPPRTPPGTIS